MKYSYSKFLERFCCTLEDLLFPIKISIIRHHKYHYRSKSTAYAQWTSAKKLLATSSRKQKQNFKKLSPDLEIKWASGEGDFEERKEDIYNTCDSLKRWTHSRQGEEKWTQNPKDRFHNRVEKNTWKMLTKQQCPRKVPGIKMWELHFNW